MAGSILPIVVSHGEGYAEFANKEKFEATQALVTMRFVNNYGKPLGKSEKQTFIAGMTTPDGRFSILMPHPERVFRTIQHSWHPKSWHEDAPWMRMLRNARKWVG